MLDTQHRPITQRVNFRLIVFLAVIAAPIVWIVVQFVSAEVSHGVSYEAGVAHVDLKALGNFPFDDHTSTIKDVPQRWRDLDGKKVALEGFMYAGMSAADEINRFQFVYNIQKCCFGGPPRVQERVFTYVPNGSVPYVGEEVRCIGTLHVAVHKNEVGATDAVYTLQLEKVEPL